MLRQFGFPIDDLRIAITWDVRVQDYHAVTMVHLDDSVLVLDVDGPPRRQQTDYRFLFSINESGIWDHKAGKRQHSRFARCHPQGSTAAMKRTILAAATISLASMAAAEQPVAQSDVEARLDALERINVTAYKAPQADDTKDATVEAILQKADQAEHADGDAQ